VNIVFAFIKFEKDRDAEKNHLGTEICLLLINCALKYRALGQGRTTVSCSCYSFRRPQTVAAAAAELFERPPNDVDGDDGDFVAVVVRLQRRYAAAVVFRAVALSWSLSSSQRLPPTIVLSATRTHRPPAAAGTSARTWPVSWPGSTTPSPGQTRSTGVLRRSPFPPDVTWTSRPQWPLLNSSFCCHCRSKNKNGY